MRRPITVALTLLVLGAALLALAAGQTWVTAHLPPSDLVGGATRARDVSLTGNQLAGGLSALALAALAAGAALLSTRGRGRIAVAALTALIGIGAIALSVHVLSAAGTLATSTSQVTTLSRTGAAPSVPTSATGWPVLALLSAAMIVAAGGLATRGAEASRGLSTRYELPQAKPATAATPSTTTAAVTPPPAAEPAVSTPDQEAAVWSALDRGEDPTARK